MKPTTIEFSFDDAKLDAINIFLNEFTHCLRDVLLVECVHEAVEFFA